MLKTTWYANRPGWTHSRLGEIWIYNEWIRSWLRNSEPRGGYHFVGCAAVANQLAAAWMWLAGAIPLSTVHSSSFLYFLLFCETHDLVWEVISVSEKRIKNCIVNIIDNVWKKWRRWVISRKPKSCYYWSHLPLLSVVYFTRIRRTSIRGFPETIETHLAT